MTPNEIIGDCVQNVKPCDERIRNLKNNDSTFEFDELSKRNQRDTYYIFLYRI